jgi:hypothetical protein
MTILNTAIERAENKTPVGVDVFWHILAIARLARDVREAQKTYFADRNQTNLIRSKQLEKELDELIAEARGA